MASEDPGFVGEDWQTYNDAPTFMLSPGNGSKTVYFKVKNSGGQSTGVSTSILLNQVGLGQVAPARAYSVAQTSDGGFVLTGSIDGTRDGGSRDVYVVKTDAIGLVEWSNTYGGDDVDEAYSVIETIEGGYAIAGYTASYEWGKNAYLIQTDHAGNLVWFRTYDDPSWGRSLIQTFDGGYALAGMGFQIDTWSDMCLLRVDFAGEREWTNWYGSPEWGDTDVANCVLQSPDGGFVVGGYTRSYGAGDWDIYLVKTSDTGEEKWSKTYGGNHSDTISSLVPSADGGYAIAGTTYSFGGGGESMYLVKTDTSGNQIWASAYSGNWYVAECTSMIQTADDGYLVAGYTKSSDGDDYVAYLVKADFLGKAVWSRTYSEFGIASVIQTVDGAYVFAGSSIPRGDGAMSLVKTDTLGEQEWVRTYNRRPE